MRFPRIMIAAPRSGSGKTMITCALLGACMERELNIVSCKCGPDYIDPMFHRTVLGISSENLDTYFTGEGQTRQLLRKFVSRQDPIPDLTIMEGVMGLYDGVGGTRKEGSSYHLASVTRTPILLVVDVHGMGRSMIPIILGMLQYDREHLIRGIILNRITGTYYETMLPILTEELSVPVLGYMESHTELVIGSRHLGLQLPEEMQDIRLRLQKAAKSLENTVDVDRILTIANSAGELAEDNQDIDRPIDHYVNQKHGEASRQRDSLRLAVAKDEAFCFYYEDNLQMLKEAGAEIVYFSPLHDQAIPENVHGLLLGGGYPELYAEQLSENQSMKASIQKAVVAGLPSIAECGGFMYLHRGLVADNGIQYPMVGVIDGITQNTGRSVRFGYIELEELGSESKEVMNHDTDDVGADGLQKTWLQLRRMKGHEFHYYDSSDCGKDARAVKPTGNRSWACCHIGQNHWWGFPHLYYPSCPEYVEMFVKKMRTYRESVI